MIRDEVRVKGIKKEILEYLLGNDYYREPSNDPVLADDMETKRCPLSTLCDDNDWGPIDRKEIKDAGDELASQEEVVECEMEESTFVSIPNHEDAASLYQLYEEDL